MFESLAGTARRIMEGVLPLYQDVNFAYGLAAVMALIALSLLLIAFVQQRASIAALSKRQLEITGFVRHVSRSGQSSSEHASEDEVEFANRFQQIDAAMSEGAGGAGRAASAWLRFRRILVFSGSPPIRATTRPNEFLYDAFPPPSWLGFAANTFVGFGLLATFVGLVAALTFASEGMQSGNAVAMQESLRDLLSAAASKFVTSIAGVGLSVVLKVAERILTADLRKHIDSLGQAIELGIRVDQGAHYYQTAQSQAGLSTSLKAQA